MGTPGTDDTMGRSNPTVTPAQAALEKQIRSVKDWKEHSDPKTKQTYYYSKTLDKSVWQDKVSERTQKYLRSVLRNSPEMITLLRSADDWEHHKDTSSQREYIHSKKLSKSIWKANIVQTEEVKRLFSRDLLISGIEAKPEKKMQTANAKSGASTSPNSDTKVKRSKGQQVDDQLKQLKSASDWREHKADNSTMQDVYFHSKTLGVSLWKNQLSPKSIHYLQMTMRNTPEMMRLIKSTDDWAHHKDPKTGREFYHSDKLQKLASKDSSTLSSIWKAEIVMTDEVKQLLVPKVIFSPPTYGANSNSSMNGENPGNEVDWCQCSVM